MANYTAADVKRLRELTGSGMMDCKKALEESEGDFDKAVEILRIKGAKDVGKRAERATAEGLVAGAGGALVELNSETDFVAKNDEFLKLAKDIAQIAIKNKAASNEELLSTSTGAETVQQRLTALIAKIGENMTLRRVKVLTASNGVVAGYSHMGGKIGIGSV